MYSRSGSGMLGCHLLVHHVCPRTYHCVIILVRTVHEGQCRINIVRLLLIIDHAHKTRYEFWIVDMGGEEEVVYTKYTLSSMRFPDLNLTWK